MLTLKLHITSNSDPEFIIRKQADYSFAFHKLYSDFKQATNKEFLKKLRNKFNLSAHEIQCLIKDVNTKQEQTKTWKEQTENKIVEIAKKITELKAKKHLTEKERRTLSTLYKNKHILTNRYTKILFLVPKKCCKN